jgi:hypothetical protein
MGEEQSAETRGSIGNAGSTDRAYASKQPDPNAEQKPFWKKNLSRGKCLSKKPRKLQRTKMG